MAECIYSNSINQSILTSGFTIPVDKWETFEKCLGVTLQKGERKDIQIILGDDRYNVTYINVNLKGDADEFMKIKEFVGCSGRGNIRECLEKCGQMVARLFDH